MELSIKLCLTETNSAYFCHIMFDVRMIINCQKSSHNMRPFKGTPFKGTIKDLIGVVNDTSRLSRSLILLKTTSAHSILFNIGTHVAIVLCLCAPFT